MYRCKRCGGVVAANVSDPVVILSAGTFHFACMRAHAIDVARAELAIARERLEKRAAQARKNFGHSTIAAG